MVYTLNQLQAILVFLASALGTNAKALELGEGKYAGTIVMITAEEKQKTFVLNFAVDETSRVKSVHVSSGEVGFTAEAEQDFWNIVLVSKKPVRAGVNESVEVGEVQLKTKVKMPDLAPAELKETEYGAKWMRTQNGVVIFDNGYLICKNALDASVPLASITWGKAETPAEEKGTSPD